MTFWQFMRGIELRDARSARNRAWLRFCYLSIGAVIATVLWDLFHRHDLLDFKGFLTGVLMVVVIGVTGAIYDFWRVRHPEKTNRYEWLRIGIVCVIAGVIYAFLLLWMIVR